VHRLRDLGKTVLLTTHYMEEAQELADRLVVIAAGRIVAEGTPDAIGGRASAGSTIRFPWPSDRGLDELPVPATRDAGDAIVETVAVTTTLRSLTEWAVTHGVDLDALTVSRPSLEDVYLELVGGDA
jgi:ABC-2 type transport system ATP-binding protein